MNLTRLQHFLTVADTGSITAAAELLHISAPALSKSVRVLETELDLNVVERAGRGIRITDDGRELAERVRPILAELATMPQAIRDHTGEGRMLRYASHETFGTSFMSMIAAPDDAPPLQHTYLRPDDMPPALERGVVDACVTYIPVASPAVDVHEIGTVRLSIWGMPKYSGLPFDELPFAAPAGQMVVSPSHMQGLDGWPDPAVARYIAHRVTHTQAAMELCLDGHAVAYMADFLVEHQQARRKAVHRLQRIAGPIGTGHDQPVYLITREGDRSEGMARMTEALLSITT